MREREMDARAIDGFCALYERYRAGDTGKLRWQEIELPERSDLVDHRELAGDESLRARGHELLRELAVIRVNGGLGTTMDLARAKSLIAVRDGQSFLDLTVQQVLRLRADHGTDVPWLAMNSFRTRDDTLAALARYPGLGARGLPVDFLQNMVPRIERARGLPARFDDDEESWAPPGHADVYPTLWQSGLLERLLALGIRWAFISNVDNLGATVDPSILGYLDARELEFAMELTPKSRADVKGGTLVRHRGRPTLLEGAQVEPEHTGEFQDITVFTVFNTNNIWCRLDALGALLERGALEMPLIVNTKRVRGVDVVQLEQAMGSAIGCFARAVGVVVPRSRFAPVKATCDLLAVRSDAYVLDADFGIRPSPRRDPRLGPPVIALDDRYYKGIAAFEARFRHPLGLERCLRLTVEGDLRFGEGVAIEGEVTLRNGAADGAQRAVPDGARFASGVHVL
jgi:UTP--glucose-1-phosphate uridylyltransferase